MMTVWLAVHLLGWGGIVDKLDHATATATRAGPMCRLKVPKLVACLLCVLISKIEIVIALAIWLDDDESVRSL